MLEKLNKTNPFHMPADKDGALCVNILVYTPIGYTQNFRACSMACGKFHNFVLLIR